MDSKYLTNWGISSKSKCLIMPLRRRLCVLSRHCPPAQNRLRRNQVTQSLPNSPPRGQAPQRGETVSPRAYAVKTPMRGWHDQNRSRPCPIDGHGSHELGTCAEFLSMTPKDCRLVSKYKVCYTCLSPLWICREMSRSTLCAYERAFQSNLQTVHRQCQGQEAIGNEYPYVQFPGPQQTYPG